ncbi:MAG: hypothetical protein KDA96_16675, partial [Planctomycetaceae bacterium]|nr:hypothetical protein [Planctomycetaceae bacterium]
ITDTPGTHAGLRFRWILSAAAVVWLAALTVAPLRLEAQEATPPRPEGNDSPASGPQILLRTETGTLVPIDTLLSPDAVTELLNRAGQQQSVPQYSISSMELKGTVSRGVVNLALELKVDVRPAKEWVTVPISFGEFHVDGDFGHTADAADARAVLDTSEAAQKKWHLFGNGTHVLSLKLIGRSRPSTAIGHQLTLSLPEATASHATFQFDSPVETPKLQTDVVGIPSADESGVRSIEIWGLPTSFTMSWADVVPTVDRAPVLQVQSRLRLDLTTIPAELSGTQTVTISGSPVSELPMKIPQGFELQEITVRSQSGTTLPVITENPDPEDTSRVLLKLPAPEIGTLTLSINLELVNSLFPQDVQIVLPQIENAAVQAGDLDLFIPPGLEARQERLNGVQRKRVTADPDPGIAATAFRMKSAESEIVLHLEEIEALFAVSPELVFQPDSQNVVMTVRLPVNVLRGSLLDLHIRWPGYAAGDWQIIPGSMQQLQNDRPAQQLAFEQPQSDVLLMKFPERLSGNFLVQFRAYVRIPDVNGESAELTLTCPDVESRTERSMVIVTRESDEYSIVPHVQGEEAPLPSLPFRLVPEQREVEEQSAQSWLHDQSQRPLQLKLKRQTASVTSTLTAGLTPEPTGIEVRETIDLLVEHGDLTTVPLTVPDGVRPVVRLKGSNERLRETTETANRWNYRLPRVHRGRLSLEVSYLWTAVPHPDAEGTTPLQVPLILPANVDNLRCEAGTDSPDGITIRDDRQWQPVYSELFAAAWRSEADVATVPIRWRHPATSRAETAPDLVLCRSVVASGQAVTMTMGIYETAPESVAFSVPSDCVLESVAIGNRVVTRQLRRLVSNTKPASESIDTPPIGTETSAPDSPDGIAVDDTSRESWLLPDDEFSRNSGEPVTVEIRIRQGLPRIRGLMIRSQLKHVAFTATTGGDVPLIWSVETDDSLRIVQTNPAIAGIQSSSMAIGRMIGKPGLTDEEVPAILSVFPEPVQGVVIRNLEDWRLNQLRQDLYLADTGETQLHAVLIPASTLLLIAATTCLIMFVIMAVFRRITLILATISGSALIIALAAISPDWGTALGPGLAAGLLLALLAMAVQRLLLSRRTRHLTFGRNKETPTVFGIPGILSDASLITKPGPAASDSRPSAQAASVSSAGI